MNTIQNPILPGFAPDASALHVGEDYYIATSTFEWWPGIEIYHSQDLVNWEWAAAPIARRDMVPSELLGNYNSGSLWAPHLSYADGLFWLVYTDVKSVTAFKDTLNYVVTAPKITGPWSAPTLVTASGFDPALFHDDDGRHYFLNMLFDWRLENPGFAGTVIQEFDPVTRQLVGARRHFYRGTSLGVCEGPQILKKDGWYYLPVGGFALFPAADRAGRCRQPAAKERSRLFCRDRRRVVHYPHLRPPPDGARKLHAGARNRPAKNRVGRRLAAPCQRHAPPGFDRPRAQGCGGCQADSQSQRARDLCAGQGPAPYL